MAELRFAGPDTRTLKEILDSINEVAVTLDYMSCRAIQEDIAEIAERFAAGGWISVDDALPKSGNHVLVCCQIHSIGGGLRNYVCIAFHSDDKSIPCGYYDDLDSVYDEETDEYYFPVGWWEVIHNWEDYSCVAIEDFVTHWMPLPKPPEVKET